MLLSGGDLGTPSSGNQKESKKAGSNFNKIDFSKIISHLDKYGSAKGFRELRNFLLLNAGKLGHFGLKDVIALVIACDKHAMFADIAASKASAKRDEARWGMFQDYMNGKVELLENEGDGENEDEDEALGLSEDEEDSGEV